MGRNPAPVKLTGGGGFSYEDHVGANYILEMIAGRQPLGSEYGQVQSVDFQTGESGWLLDDLLIALGSGSLRHHVALSAKSYRYVTRNGFPADFVRLIWQQWLHKASNVFQEDRDLLGLVVKDLADSVEREWMGMLREAQESTPERTVAALTTGGPSNSLQRKLFTSLACPADLQQGAETDRLATTRLLKHIRLLHMDFLAEPSKSVGDCLVRCQEVLTSGDAQEASRLWEDVLRLAADLRPRRGSINLPKAIRRLSGRHALRVYPDHAADWDRLSAASLEEMSRVHCSIGTQNLPRTGLLAAIKGKLEKERAVVLIGDSGAGKSAAARMLAQESEAKGQQILWLSNELLNEGSVSDLERKLRLAHSLSDVLRALPAAKGLIAVDAVDRLSQEGIACAAGLLRAAGVLEDECQWRVLATSQPEGWEHIFPELLRHGMDRHLFVQHVVELPEIAAIRSLVRQFPQIEPLLLRPEFIRLFRNLKILDWVTRAVMTAEATGLQRWVNPTDVVTWVWEQWIGRNATRHARDGVLKRLADKEAESLAAGVALTDLDAGQQAVVGDLEQCGLVRCSAGRAYLQHDLLGDWARLQFLVGQGVDAPRALKAKAGFLRWHTAMRLYGEWLLERADEQPREWRETMAVLSDSEPDEHIVRDLLLESVVLAMNSSVLLELLWPDLVANGGELLTRLLKRFLHVGTTPDPRVRHLAKTDDEVKQLAAIMRVPYWPYWGPVLSCLSRHRDAIPLSSQHAAAEVCCLWLETTAPEIEAREPFPWRRETAEAAIAMARETQALKAEGVYFHDDLDEKPYEAALHTAPDLPDEVSQLSLELCRRRDESPQISSRREAATRRRTEETEARLKADPEQAERLAERAREFTSLGREDWPLKPPWPHGPLARVDDAFRTVCLKTQALTRLIDTRPEVASEVLLALSIEEPKPDAPLQPRSKGSSSPSRIS